MTSKGGSDATRTTGELFDPGQLRAAATPPSQRPESHDGAAARKRDGLGHTRVRPAVCRADSVVLLALQQPHVGGLGALRALRNVELDGLPLVKRAVAVGLDRAEMHEEVLASLGRDEPIALLGVEPLHGSNSHEPCPSLHHLGGLDHASTIWLAARDKLNLRIPKAKREPLPPHHRRVRPPAASKQGTPASRRLAMAAFGHRPVQSRVLLRANSVPGARRWLARRPPQQRPEGLVPYSGIG